METCTNCGATIRSGARFCTTCGTRVATANTNDNDWGATTSAADTEDQQTALLEPIKPAEPELVIAGSGQNDRWANGWATPSPATHESDPASRFITALDDEVKPTTDDAITASWNATQTSWGHGDRISAENSWRTPQSVSQAASDTEPPVVPAAETEPNVTNSVTEVEPTIPIEEATIRDDATTAVDETSPSLPLMPDDPRHRVIELLTELQVLVPKITIADESSAASTLTEASQKATDYADLRTVINQVKENPRDIQALSDLSGKVERIESLLEEHTTLTDAIESALRNLNH